MENANETGAPVCEPEKKQPAKGIRILLWTVGILVAVALIMLAAVFILSKAGHSALTDADGGMNVESGTENTGTIRYNGKLYRYNDEITSVLLMGVDEYQKYEYGTSYGYGNQSDVNVLAVLDPVKEKMTFIAISRDTMCEMDVLNSEGEYSGTARAQLALAYSLGEGGEKSCEITRDAVSRIFYGLSIPAYGSIYMYGVSDIINSIGGVTIVPSIDFGACRAGVETTLDGYSARRYIQHRNATLEGNNERMERQKQVMLALVRDVLAKVREDPVSILDVYRAAQSNVTTNLNASMIVYLAQLATKLSFDGEIHSIPGESVPGANNHAEFIVDDEVLYKMVLDIFYIEVEEG